MLFVKNNLNDVECIKEIRNVFQFGNVIDLHNDKVNIIGGAIQIDSFAMKINGINKDLYFKSINNSGNIELANYIQADWIKSETKEIPIEIFYNDIDALMITDVHPNMYRGDYKYLDSIPKLSEALPIELYNTFAQKDANMSDCIVENIDDIFNLSEYSSCNITDSFTVRNLKLENLTLTSLSVAKPALLSYNNTLLYLSNFQFTNKFTYGRCKYIDTDDQHIDLLLPSSMYMFQYVEKLNTNIMLKTNIVRQYKDELTHIIEKFSNIYLKIENRFLDVNNVSITRRNLGIDKLHNFIHISDNVLEVDVIKYEFYQRRSKIILRNVKRINDLQTFGYLYFDDANVYHYKHRYEFEFGTTLQYGVCKIETYQMVDIIEEYNKTFNILIFEHNKNIHFNDMDMVIHDIPLIHKNILETNILISPKNRLLKENSNLSELSIVNDFSGIYENLEIFIVSYIPNYNFMINTPTVLSSFTNDIPYLSSLKNLSEFDVQSQIEAREHLLVNSLGIQNIDNVNIIGIDFNMDFLSVTSKMSLYEDVIEGRFLTFYGWEGLYEYDIDNQEERGILIMNDQMVMVDNLIDIYLSIDSDKNTTYTMQILIEFEKRVNHELDMLLSEILSLRQS